MASILVIEDDAFFRRALEAGLRACGYEVFSAADGPEGLEHLAAVLPAAVMLDLNLGQGMGGLEVLEHIRSRHPALPVVIMTAFGSVESAVQAMQTGAADYIQKPVKIQEVSLVVERCIEMASLRREVGYLRRIQHEKQENESLVVASLAMRRAQKTALDLAKVDGATVMLRGEVGTGKSLMARLIHDESRRRQRPYVTCNCAAYPNESILSELFGEGGAPGRLAVADGGTLVLSEVDRLGLEAQARLLDFLDEGGDVAGGRQIRFDVRLVVLTCKDLEAEVEAGRFRQDLALRFDHLSIELPPLRQRREDIIPLARQFMRQSSAGSFATIETSAAAWLMEREWPGNVRELRNTIERVSILAEGRALRVEYLEKAAPSPDTPHNFGETLEALPTGEVFDRVMRLLCEEALHRCQGNAAEAGRWLGISRPRFMYRLKQCGIDLATFKGRRAGGDE